MFSFIIDTLRLHKLGTCNSPTPGARCLSQGFTVFRRMTQLIRSRRIYHLLRFLQRMDYWMASFMSSGHKYSIMIKNWIFRYQTNISDFSTNRQCRAVHLITDSHLQSHNIKQPSYPLCTLHFIDNNLIGKLYISSFTLHIHFMQHQLSHYIYKASYFHDSFQTQIQIVLNKI